MSSDEKLEEYRKRRDFHRTKEPAGDNKRSADKPVFVIQKHDASSLHYDFRIEMDEVLKSWAVPKGPSTDPSVKRMAIPTEDHPLDYADFEGVIPEGEYGAGTVMVWDTGSYRNLRADKDDEMTSMQQSYDEGKLEVYLDGKKIKGGYALIRIGDGEDTRWLLIKMDDNQADARRNPTSTEPKSALTGRSLEEIQQEDG